MTRQPSLGIREHVPLAPLTTLGVGGPSRFYLQAVHEDHILAGLDFAHDRGLPLLILGGGSNLLVADAGFPGLALHISTQGRAVDFAAGRITLAAGEEWDAFVLWAVEQGWAGIECLSGIPGSVGAAPVQNVGAYGQEVSETIEIVRALERTSQNISTLTREVCHFGYRSSVFNTDQRDRFIILSVTFRLQPGGPPRIGYADLRRWFDQNSEKPSLCATREAVLAVRSAKSMVLRKGDPDCRSAGSFFKNPVVTEDHAASIRETARRLGLVSAERPMPGYRTEDGMKIPAAWLLECAGFSRGYIYGRAGLSSRHALAIVNRGGASAAEILEFSRLIQARIRDLFAVELVPEPVMVGFL